ncbi:MAG: hypothetical protein NTV34_18820 [Proteobacteria bacterium]|nr:hypothetical protein [Pseudomonadota bacterium]
MNPFNHKNLLRWIVFGFSLSIAGALASSCRARSHDAASTTKKNGRNNQDSEGNPAKKWLFTGACAPSSSECRSSCPHHNGAGFESPELCPSYGGPPSFACVCPFDAPARPIPPSDTTHYFRDCFPNAPECVHSCPVRKIVAQQNSDRCSDPYEFACYCQFQP